MQLALLAPRRAPEDIDMVTASLAAAKGPLVAVVRPVNQGDGQSEAPAAINAVEPTPGVKGRRSRRNPFQALLATLQPGVATAQASGGTCGVVPRHRRSLRCAHLVFACQPHTVTRMFLPAQSLTSTIHTAHAGVSRVVVEPEGSAARKQHQHPGSTGARCCMVAD